MRLLQYKVCDARLASGIDFPPVTSPTKTTTLNIIIDASLLGVNLARCPIYRWPAILGAQQYSQPPPHIYSRQCLPATNNKSGRNLSLSRTYFMLPVMNQSHRPPVHHTQRRPAAGTTSSRHQKLQGAPDATELPALTSRPANPTWSNTV